MSLIAAKILVCEKVLQDRNAAISAIRIVDVFYFTRRPALPIEQQGLGLRVEVLGQVEVGDEVEHTLELLLIRPDGERTLIGKSSKLVFKSSVPDTPSGFGINAQISVVPKKMGVHFFVLFFDSKEVVRTPFTLVERTPELVH